MKKEMNFLLISIFICLFLIGGIFASVIEAEQRLSFGHILNIESITITPENVIPGQASLVEISVRNTGKESLFDFRSEIELPDGLSFVETPSKVKISSLSPGQTANLKYNVLAHPSLSDGFYDLNITFDYISHVGTQRTETQKIGIPVRGNLNIFAKIETSEIYNGNDIGEITITFINNDLGDIKFLTVELLDSEDYKIISSPKEYVGDLDSDDFEAVDFRIKLETRKKEINFPVKIDYRDSLNNPYSQEMNVVFNKNTSKELGIDGTSTTGIVIAIVLIGVLGYLYYRKKKGKKKSKDYK